MSESERPAPLTFQGFLRGVLADSIEGQRPMDRRTDRVKDAAMTVAEITGRTDSEALAWVLSRRPGWAEDGDHIPRAAYDAIVDEAADEAADEARTHSHLDVSRSQRALSRLIESGDVEIDDRGWVHRGER